MVPTTRKAIASWWSDPTSANSERVFRSGTQASSSRTPMRLPVTDENVPAAMSEPFL